MRWSTFLLASWLVGCDGRLDRDVDPSGLPAATAAAAIRAFASNACTKQPAIHAADGDAATAWRSCSIPSPAAPAWLAYDIRALGAKRRSALVLWYNRTVNYDVSVFTPDQAINLPRDYTLEGHEAATESPPSDGDPGWVVLEEVQRNSMHSRQSLLDLSRFSWLRMRVTASDGTPDHYEVELELLVHDGAARADDWIFFGDSNTAVAMSPYPLFRECTTCDRRVDGFAALLREKEPARAPIGEVGGIKGATASVASARLSAWLGGFPGRYVGLAFGTNDAGQVRDCDEGCVKNFGRAYESMIASVLAVNKVPLVPTIPPLADPGLNANVARLNAELARILAATPAVVRGPDLFGYFSGRLDRLQPDGVHLTADGYAEYRLLWVDVASALKPD